MSCQVSEISEWMQEALAAAQGECLDTEMTGTDTLERLIALAQAWPGPPAPEHLQDLNAICHKLSATGTLLARYGAGWKATNDSTALSVGGWKLAIATLLAWSDVPEQMGGDGHGMAAKCLNAALRATDESPGDGDALRVLAETQIALIDLPDGSEATPDLPSPRSAMPADSRTLPLTVMAYEGPCVRAYLSMMRRAGLRPERIVLLVLSEHPATGKPVGTWFPGRLRSWYAEKTQEQALNFWPRRIRASCPELVRTITAGLEPLIDRPNELLSEMYGPFRYEAYADKVERVVVRDLKDDALVQAVKKLGATTVLFTGGGILPRKLIDLSNVRFLHVHPGHLPDVRGADGLLWSTLVRGRPAMSCFFLASGLDTGEVVAVRDYPPLAFELSNPLRPDDQTLYRAIFSFVDPLLRADLLVHDVLGRADDPRHLKTTRQDPGAGVTYHFMHESLRRRVLDRLFPSA